MHAQIMRHFREKKLEKENRKERKLVPPPPPSAERLPLLVAQLSSS